MKRLLILFILFAAPILKAQVVNCPDKNQKGYSCDNVDEDIIERLHDENYKMPTRFNVTVTPFTDQDDQDKAARISSLCNQVLNDPDFWNALEKYDKYKYAVFESGGIKREISGPQILNCLINGSPDDNNRPVSVDIVLNIKLYGLSFKAPFETALGKEIGDGKIYNKKWFFRKYPYEQIGSNWIHEFSHTRGLTHCYYCNEERDYSVPYVINRIFEEVAQKYIP